MGLIYSHRAPDWPNYTWDRTTFSADLAAVHFRRGQLFVAMAALGIEARQESDLSDLVQDVLKSSEIEGEHLDAQQARSSIARRLALEYAGLEHSSREIAGQVVGTQKLVA